MLSLFEYFWHGTNSCLIIVFDTEKSVPEKLEQSASRTGSLFVHRLGDSVVKVIDADAEITVNHRMQEYIERLAEDKW